MMKIQQTTTFSKQFKKLHKKYNSFKNDFLLLYESLLEKPIQGTKIGENTYKIRLAISAKQKGKSSGARIITYLVLSEETLIWAAIYDKSEVGSMSDAEIQAILTKHWEDDSTI